MYIHNSTIPYISVSWIPYIHFHGTDRHGVPSGIIADVARTAKLELLLLGRELLEAVPWDSHWKVSKYGWVNIEYIV